LAIQPPQ